MFRSPISCFATRGQHTQNTFHFELLYATSTYINLLQSDFWYVPNVSALYLFPTNIHIHKQAHPTLRINVRLYIILRLNYGRSIGGSMYFMKCYCEKWMTTVSLIFLLILFPRTHLIQCFQNVYLLSFLFSFFRIFRWIIFRVAEEWLRSGHTNCFYIYNFLFTFVC